MLFTIVQTLLFNFWTGKIFQFQTQSRNKTENHNRNSKTEEEAGNFFCSFRLQLQRFSLLPCESLSSQYSHLYSRYSQCVAQKLQTPRRLIPLKLAAKPSCVITMPVKTLELTAKPSKKLDEKLEAILKLLQGALPINPGQKRSGNIYFRPLCIAG